MFSSMHKNGCKPFFCYTGENQTQEVIFWRPFGSKAREKQGGREGGQLRLRVFLFFSYDSFKKLVEASIKVFQDYSEHVFNSKTRTLHQSFSQLGGGASRHRAVDERMTQ